MEFILLLYVDKEDGLPLKAEDFVLHVDMLQTHQRPGRVISSSSTRREVIKDLFLLHDIQEFILTLRVDDDAEDKHLSAKGEEKILVVLGREESKSGVPLPPLCINEEDKLLSVEKEDKLIE